MKKLISIALIVFLSTGCSVFMAAKQPSAKNLDVMSIGTPRSVVLAEFGQPVNTSKKGGLTVDVFSFVQGYSSGTKASRAIFHGLADVFTLGIWEVAGTPIESYADGTKVAYEVTYGDDDKVTKVVPLTEKSREEGPKQIQSPQTVQEAEVKPQP